MASLTSVNLIRVHWSQWWATTCWLACNDMCLSYFQLDSVIHCTTTLVRTQLRQQDLINWLTSVFTVAYSQLSYTHSFNLNDLLGNPNCLGIHAPCMIIVLYNHSFIWLYRVATSIAAPFCQFYAYLPVFFVRLYFQFLDHCDKLIWYQSSWQDKALSLKNNIFED